MSQTELILALGSLVGSGSIVNFFVQRYFSKKDEKTRNEIKRNQERQRIRDEERKQREEQKDKEMQELVKKVNTGLDTIRLLSYHRMSQEIERLLDQGYATPAERKVLSEMFDNYKEHGWNGDMDARLEKVHRLRTAPPED